MKDATTYIELLTQLFPNEGLSFSVHHKITFESGDVALPGQVFTDAIQAERTARYWSNKGHDVYLAMGGEREIGTSDKPRRHPPAIRKRYNVGACSALYLDVDVKDGAYASRNDALTALKKFIWKNKLPMPTLMVESGTGGIHTYWVTDELFPPAEFELFATSLVNMANSFGLKFDSECTKDLCRLLRIPDTYNFKTNPALPVKLLYSGSKISLKELREKLKVDNVIPLRPQTTPNTADDNDDLLKQKRQYPPADISVVATFCQFLHNTLTSGGRDLKEALWKQTVTLASYCEDGRDVAHKLSNAHPAYTKEETDFKYDQVETDRKNNPRLGPTHCSVLRQMGVTECDVCPYFQLNTTPINVPSYNATPKFVPSHNPNSDLPTGYYRDKDSTIWKDVTDSSDGTSEAVQVFPYTIIYNSTFAEGGTKDYNFVFSTLEGNGHNKVVKLPMAAVANKEGLMAALAKNGLSMMVTEQTRKFLVAFQTMLRNNDDTLITTSPIGWHKMPGGETGFAYNGNLYLPSNKVVKAQRLDPELARNYSVVGSEKVWQELSTLIIAQNRPDINLIIACGFGAPLMSLTGHAGIAVGGWSTGSGIGKSTALALCQAIWGSASRMQGLDDTVNQVMDTMATLKNMPLCWDDIKGSQQTERMANMLFMITRGREKGRLTRNAKQAEQRDFETLLVWTANNPMADEIAKATRGTDAGRYRLFEFNVHDVKSDLNVGHITNLTGELKKNYGHIGQRYAEYIGRNHDKILGWVTAMRDKIDTDLQTNQSERFWSAAAACIIVGARLSNGLRLTQFDLTLLQEYIYERIRVFRKTISMVSGDFSQIGGVETVLSEFLHAMAMNTIKTDNMATGRGRPTMNAVRVLNDNIVFARQAIYVQISKNQLLCRFSDPALGKWLKDQGIIKSAFTVAMQKHLNAFQTRGRIGSGTEYVSTPIAVWEIDLSQTTLGQEIEF